MKNQKSKLLIQKFREQNSKLFFFFQKDKRLNFFIKIIITNDYYDDISLKTKQKKFKIKTSWIYISTNIIENQ